MVKITSLQKKDLKEVAFLVKKLDDFHQKLDSSYKGGTFKECFFYCKELFHKRNAKIFVARDQKRIVGFLVAMIKKTKYFFKPLLVGKISRIFVEEDFRQKKIGEKLVEKAFEWFKKKKVKFVEVQCFIKNKNALNFWKKMGFVEFAKKLEKKI